MCFIQSKNFHFMCVFFCIQNGSNLECPDLDFVYSDTDTHPNEIAELYSYTEQNEFHLNIRVGRPAPYVQFFSN